jgi:hypothetical protein
MLFAGVVSRIRPHRRLIGLPLPAGPDTQWVTIMEDRGSIAGPEAFDTETLQWWVSRADMIVVDAAQPHRGKARMLGAAALAGHRLLIVETLEQRREAWHQILRGQGNPNSKTPVLQFRNCPVPGLLHYCTGFLDTDFPAELPPLPAAQPEAGQCSGAVHAADAK